MPRSNYVLQRTPGTSYVSTHLRGPAPLNTALGLRAMRAHLLVVLALCACSDRQPLTTRACFEATEQVAQTPLGEKVLADARMRSAARCDGAQEQCHFRVSVHPDGTMGVFVQFALLNIETGECMYPIGGHEGHQYDAQGRFTHTMPGL